MTQRIKVVVRPKPLAKDQLKTYASIDYINSTISMTKPSQKNNNLLSRDNTIRAFAFSKIFSPNASQQEVYEQCGFSIVQNVLEGYNGTIFAYGQTGSGKTYTIMGSKQYMERKTNVKKENITATTELQEKEKQIFGYINVLKGIIPRTFNQIIAVTKSQTNKKHLITCSFIQIYNENVHDLLGDDIKSNLSIKESQNKGLVIEGLKTFIVKSVEELQKFLKVGYRNRSVRQTTMNKQSSRSHCIFTIKIQEQTTDQYGNARFRVGKLNLVDLAGSERQNKTHAKQQGIKEATKINLSLSALGKVINCLSNHRPNQKVYIPYRDSKLTRILQDSLGGNTKTVMIATIATNSSNYQQTLSTLIYASRAKFIQNSPILNQDPKDVLLRQYMDEIKKLKLLLQQKQIENQDLKQNKVIKKGLPNIEINDINVKTQQKFDQGQLKQKKNSQDEQLQIKLNKSKVEEDVIKKKLQNLENIVKKQNIQKEQIKELEKIQQLKTKIKIQQERQIQLQKQKKQREEELLSIQKDYKNLNQEVDTIRQKFKDLKTKYLYKCQQLEDYRKEYNEDKIEYHYIIKQKDKQIKKLEKMLATVLQQQTYKQVVDQNEESGYSENESNYSTNKFLNNIKVQNKAKVKFNEVNLFKESKSKKSSSHKQVSSYENQFIPTKKERYSIDRPIASKNYDSEHEKKVKKVETNSNYTSLTNLKVIDKEKDKKDRIKKVDSLISLKPKKGGTKLPFITQVKKLNNQRLHQQSSGNYISKMGIDLGKIKNEILSQFRIGKGKYY